MESAAAKIKVQVDRELLHGWVRATAEEEGKLASRWDSHAMSGSRSEAFSFRERPLGAAHSPFATWVRLGGCGPCG